MIWPVFIWGVLTMLGIAQARDTEAKREIHQAFGDCKFTDGKVKYFFDGENYRECPPPINPKELE